MRGEKFVMFFIKGDKYVKIVSSTVIPKEN